MEVLPLELFDKFSKFIKEKKFLDAEKLFVSISKNRYMQNRDLITFSELESFKKVFPVIRLKYCNEVGLLNDEVKEIGGKKVFSFTL